MIWERQILPDNARDRRSYPTLLEEIEDDLMVHAALICPHIKPSHIGEMITDPLAVIDGQLNPAMTINVRAPAAQVGCQIVVKGCLGVSEQGCCGRCPTDELESIVYLLQKDPRSFLETVL